MGKFQIGTEKRVCEECKREYDAIRVNQVVCDARCQEARKRRYNTQRARDKKAAESAAALTPAELAEAKECAGRG